MLPRFWFAFFVAPHISPWLFSPQWVSVNGALLTLPGREPKWKALNMAQLPVL